MLGSLFHIEHILEGDFSLGAKIYLSSTKIYCIHSSIVVELAWRSGCVMDCHATTQGSIHGEDELHVLRMGQLMGAPFPNDLVIDRTLNKTNQRTSIV